MILSSTSHWTYRCPLAPLNAVRWTVGGLSALLWLRVGFAELTYDSMMWTLLAAVISAQVFGTLSSAMLMLRMRISLLQRFTDWYAIVTSVMTWVLGVGAIISNGLGFLQLALVLGAVAIGISWLVLIYFGLRPIRLGAIARE
jgi:hypothetical protein